ncbi:group 1 truncated hemoglobin [Kangiella marina]|uniref:Group 1 truncated hemoglobin n=1 Tax=Kangiella marina TaxID=1079178 RepID=A0ABP8IEK2_9GAMM
MSVSILRQLRAGLLVVALGVLSSAVMSCAYHQKPSLYQQLGEKEGIANVVDNLALLIASDPMLRPRFVDVDLFLFRTHLIEQLCKVSNGPCEYTGGSMKEVHRGLDISDAEFNRLVTHLREAMTKEQIPYVAQNELLSKLAPMHSDVTYQ